jgi:hypothetical protein
MAVKSIISGDGFSLTFQVDLHLRFPTRVGENL